MVKRHTDENDYQPERNGKSVKAVICGIIIIIIAGWIAYVTTQGLKIETTKAELIASIALTDKKVAVLENIADTMKADIVEVKNLLKEIRTDQKRRARNE